MQLLRVAHRRRGLVAHSLDRVGVKLAQIALMLRQAAARHHRARAPLLQRRVVEEAERIDVDDPLRHRRGRHGVARVQANLAGLDAIENLLQPFGIDRLVQAVVHRLRD